MNLSLFCLRMGCLKLCCLSLRWIKLFCFKVVLWTVNCSILWNILWILCWILGIKFWVHREETNLSGVCKGLIRGGKWKWVGWWHYFEFISKCYSTGMCKFSCFDLVHCCILHTLTTHLGEWAIAAHGMYESHEGSLVLM